MGNLNPPEAPSRRFPRAPESVASARRFVRAALEDAASDVVSTAQLLVSELVTNAVMHARTEVEVSVAVSGGKVRVGVSDQRPRRVLVPYGCPPYAGTGQGLALVEGLASRCGVDTGEGRKTVWFELRPNGPPVQPSRLEIAAPPYGSGATVTLVDVPEALYSASRQHRHTLLRELALAASAGGEGLVRPEDLATAHDMSNVISASVTAAMNRQPPEADTRSLALILPADAASAVHTLRRVLDLAEEAARHERVLTLPALPHSRVFQQWLFDQIIGQLVAGEEPTAWTVVPREPGAHSSELMPWDADHVRNIRVPTIAADETNRIIAANGPAAGMLGWPVDDLLGRRLTTLVPEHLRERHIAAFTSLLLTGQPRILDRSVPLPALHRDGRLVPVRLSIQVQETADGRTVFIAQLTPRATAPAHASRPPGWSRQTAPQEPDTPQPPPVPGHDRTTNDTETDMSALERLSLLADAGAALSTTPDLDEGLHRVGNILTRRLADWCAVDLFDEDAQVDRVCVVHRAPKRTRPEDYEGRLPPVSETARGPLARALRGAGPLLLTDPLPSGPAENPLDAHYLEVYERLGASSAIVAPLRARQEVIGALTVARTREEQPFTEEDLFLVGDLVQSLALGVDNVHLHQETRNIAERLQRSLLPALPEVGHLQLAARYAASSTTAQVGGDWYDSFITSEGHVALVIGDVTGHNLDAAIAMSQLRSMLRGIAVGHQEPPETVLRRLDLANHSLHHESTATCIYGVVKGPEGGPWELEHSSAGHLPPLLTTEEGDTRYLEGGAGLLLGMYPDTPRRRARNTLPAHSTVLLYTDGLIERRDESLDHAMARLRRHTAALAREPLDVFCDELLIGLGADNADDIAILALRPTPPS